MNRLIKEHKMITLFMTLVMVVFFVVIFTACGTTMETIEEDVDPAEVLLEEDMSAVLDPDGYYTSKEDVALYLRSYGELPPNYITKAEASDLGWQASEGNLWDVTDQKSIGGDRFGNREGLLPDRSGRQYYECDINYEGGYRGAERIVYSNDGLVYYTPDHYESFELMYGEE